MSLLLRAAAATAARASYGIAGRPIDAAILKSSAAVHLAQRRHKTHWPKRYLPNPPRDIKDQIQISHSGRSRQNTGDPAEGEAAHDQAWTAKRLNRDWRRHQRHVKKVQSNVVPERFKKYDEEFDRVSSFQSQLQALQSRGFLRPYKPYKPPTDLDERFMKVCGDVIPGFGSGEKQELYRMALERPMRQKLLLALEAEFSHSVPNSLLHTMTTVDRVLHFYSTNVDVRTPYEKLDEDAKRGKLPPNLHIQLNPLRFGDRPPAWASADSPLNTVTAYPGENTVMVTPEARKKYKDVIQEEQSPWVNSYADMPKPWGPRRRP